MRRSALLKQSPLLDLYSWSPWIHGVALSDLFFFAKLSLLASKGWEALFSLVRCRRLSVPHSDISTDLHSMMFKTIQTIYFLKAFGPRISKLILPSVSCTNTQIQIHKYTITAYEEVPERPNMWYIFEKRIVQGYQKLYSHMTNEQIQKYKYTITQIQHMTKCQKDPTCGIFLKRELFKDVKKYIPIQYKLEHLSFAQLYEV